MAETLLNYFDVLPISAVLLLPGFFWISVGRKFANERPRDTTSTVLSYLAASAFSFVVFTLVFWDNLIEIRDPTDISRGLAIQAVSLLFGVAVFGGVVTGLVRRTEFISWLLSKCSIHSLRACTSGWDRAFGRHHGCLVRVEVENGDPIWGIYGRESCASAELKDHDLFLQEVWVPTNNGLARNVGSKGIWLKAKQIRWIKFFDVEGLDNDHARQQCSSGTTTSTKTERVTGPITTNGESHFGTNHQGTSTLNQSAQTKPANRQPRQPTVMSNGQPVASTSKSTEGSTR
ncbi:MAG: hypothetical protein KF859_04450 [Phycisphaeraceae bacterium]|nr:hypothetical protein [Phycisphaeraceae bacterium]